METSGANPDIHYVNSSSVSASGVNISDNDSDNTTNTWFGIQIPGSLNPFRSPLSLLLEYSGILRSTSAHDSHAAALDNGVGTPEFRPELRDHTRDCASEIAFSGSECSSSSTREVSIQIIGNGERYNGVGSGTDSLPSQNEFRAVGFEEGGSLMGSRGGNSPFNSEGDSIGVLEGERVPLVASSSSSSSSFSDGNGANELAGNTGDSPSYLRYDIQQIARWIEQILPFSLLLLVVFIRQHLQGFFVTIWISAILFNSNDIVRKQTTLKGDRRTSVLLGISKLFIVHVIFIYCWYQNDDILYPLIMIPPKTVPPFWHAIFIVMVNDTLMRQAAMAVKCLILLYYKKGRGHNFRHQGQMLTLVEYALLLYRALLPTPVWYRFFLNKDYGSLFSSLTTGLYLTFKLTSVVEEVHYLFSAYKAMSRKEVHYGVYATLAQVNAAGDLCAICQEKMHAPFILRCKHIFCEECVSEWFERERTCPLCRAMVKLAELRSFGDGSTSLLFQLF